MRNLPVKRQQHFEEQVFSNTALQNSVPEQASVKTCRSWLTPHRTQHCWVENREEEVCTKEECWTTWMGNPWNCCSLFMDQVQKIKNKNWLSFQPHSWDFLLYTCVRSLISFFFQWTNFSQMLNCFLVTTFIICHFPEWGDHRIPLAHFPQSSANGHSFVWWCVISVYLKSVLPTLQLSFPLCNFPSHSATHASNFPLPY